MSTKTKKETPAKPESNGAAGENGKEPVADNHEANQQAAVERMVARFTEKREEKEVDKLFRALVKLEGSDLHLKVGKPPIVRVNGTLKPLNRPPIEVEEMARLLFPMMNDRNREIFDEEGGADFAYVIDVDGTDWRFRVNMLQQLGKIGLVARRVNNHIPNFEGLYLPPKVETLMPF